jgi:hypothetical protein
MRLERFSGNFVPVAESALVLPPDVLEFSVPSKSIACCRLFSDLYLILNMGEPHLSSGGCSFSGEELFCRNSLRFCELPFFTYSFVYEERSIGSSIVLAGRCALFSALDVVTIFAFGIVSMGGGSGFIFFSTMAAISASRLW